MPDLQDGESTEMQGSGAKPYILKNTGGVYSCSCPAWRNQSITIERRTCKHLRKLRGDAAEETRIGGALPAGVEEIPIEGTDERQVAYFLRPHAALVVAEIFSVDFHGELRVCASPALKRPDELEASLGRIMELPVERLLVSHGEPVLEDAKARMAEALARRQ